MAREKRTKWGVITGTKYVCDEKDAMGWTYEKEDAESHAQRLGGIVVDAARFCTDVNYRCKMIRAAQKAKAA